MNSCRLECLADPSKFGTRGLKTTCALNETLFHVTGNLTGDAMHDLLEGILPFETKAVLHELIIVEQLFTLPGSQ